MTVDIRCPKCGGHFSSSQNYESHLPCGGSKTYGGSGDLRKAKEGEAGTDGGTGSNATA